MKTNQKGIVLLITYIFVTQLIEVSADKRASSVIQLNPQNFQDTVYSSLDTWLIYLYAPWCSHCTKLTPEWQKAAKRLEGKVKVAKIDPSDNKFRPKFNQMYGLVGFPRIVIIPAGVKDRSIYDVFEGPRLAQDIQEWTNEKIKTHKAFAVERILSQAQWKQNCLEVSASLCFISILPNLLDSSDQERAVYIQTIKEVAKTLRNKPLSFLWAEAGNHPEFQQTFGLSSGYPVSLIISPPKKAFTLMRSSLTAENLENWFNQILRSKGRGWKRVQHNIVFNDVSLAQRAETVDFSQEEL